jgi:hypothetical protein
MIVPRWARAVAGALKLYVDARQRQTKAQEKTRRTARFCKKRLQMCGLCRL